MTWPLYCSAMQPLNCYALVLQSIALLRTTAHAGSEICTLLSNIQGDAFRAALLSVSKSQDDRIKE